MVATIWIVSRATFRMLVGEGRSIESTLKNKSVYCVGGRDWTRLATTPNSKHLQYFTLLSSLKLFSLSLASRLAQHSLHVTLQFSLTRFFFIHAPSSPTTTFDILISATSTELAKFRVQGVQRKGSGNHRLRKEGFL